MPHFTAQPQYTTKDLGNGYWELTYSWVTDIPTTSTLSIADRYNDDPSAYIEQCSLPEGTEHTYTIERSGEPLQWLSIKIEADGQSAYYQPTKSMPRIY